MFKINNKDTWRCSGDFIVNFKHISRLVLSVSIVIFEHLIAGWVLAMLNFHRFSPIWDVKMGSILQE